MVLSAAAQSQPEAALDGTVTDTVGGRLPDATVRLYSLDRVLQAETDEAGRFRFARVPPGTYQVEASRPGFKTKQAGALRVAGENAPLSVVLSVTNTGGCAGRHPVSYTDATGDASLMGVVLDYQQQSVAGARVSVVSASGFVAAAGRTNSKGEVRLAGLDPGRYVLRVMHPKYQEEATESFWVARENTTKVTVRMVKRGMILVCE